jgi:hypothetical protein
MIHSILFDKYYWPNSKDRLYYIRHHFNLEPIKRVHTTERYYRYRIVDPKLFKKFRTIHLNNNITVVLGY